MIYFIQSLLLPMSQTCYNSKVLKVIILNTWLFVFFSFFTRDVEHSQIEYYF